MTMPDFLLPDLGEGLEEAEVISWHVQVGDHVEVDQIVTEVEPAKAVVAVPIPFAGLVSALHAEPGATVSVGAPLISVADEADDRSGNVLIGYGTSAAPRRPRRTGRRAAITGPAAPTLAPAPASATAAPVTAGPVPVISPLVRKLARDGGLDLASIEGTGPMGMVRRHDVEQALAAARQPATNPAPDEAAPASNEAGPQPDKTRRPCHGIGHAVPEKLARS